MPGLTPFLETETHGIVTRAGNLDRVSSDRQRWSALYASAQRELPFEGRFGAVKDQLLVLHRSGPVEIERFDLSRPQLCTVPRGGVHLYPGGAPFSVRLLDELDSMHVYLRRAVIEEVAGELAAGDPASVEIPPEITGDDPILTHMMDAIHHALGEDDYATTLYVDHLARALAVHLVRRYSGTRLREARPAGMGADLTRAIDFMQAHLDQAITLDKLAAAVGRSPSHLGRQFRDKLGQAPHSYLIGLRLDHARTLLEKTATPIAVIAADCGFSHQEHMTRLFRRRFGTTPAAYRRSRRH